MPPNTAMRSGIVTSGGWVAAQCPELVTGMASLVAQGKGGKRLSQRCTQHRIGSFQQDRTDMHAPVADDPTVVTDQLALVEPVHHLPGDTFVSGIAALPLHLGP